MTDLAVAGAQAIILGCTEISLLVSRDDALVLLFDTTALHADAAVAFALGGWDIRQPRNHRFACPTHVRPRIHTTLLQA